MPQVQTDQVFSGAWQQFLGICGPRQAEKLSPLQRVVLVTDGNLIATLEAVFLEPIRVRKLGQHECVLDENTPVGVPGEAGLTRAVLLVGVTTGRVYAHATSLIALGELSPAFQDALLLSDVPIGRLWVTHRMELYKEFVELSYQPAADLANHLSCGAGEWIIRRSYRVFTTSRPVMLISEHLPIHLFLDE